MIEIEKNKKELIKKLTSILLKEKNIVFAYIFGSFCEEEKNFKDIDIGIYIKDKFIKKIDIVEFEIYLSLKLEKIISFSIDIKIINYAPLGFKYQVTKGILLFSKNEGEREEFICKTRLEYYDFQPIAKSYLQEVLNG
jgi:predicted nucleotidyltransferase